MENVFEDVEFLRETALEKIQLGTDLIEELNAYVKCPGTQKLQRKINQEIKFLRKVLAKDSLRINHVTCSNLTHYSFLLKVLALQIDVVHLDCGFQNEERENPLRVDIVCENGMKWVKVVARNTKSLTEAAQGRASYGAKSIVDQAREFVQCAKDNLYMFREPKITFYFSNQLDEDLYEEISSTGIELITLDNNCNIAQICPSSEDILYSVSALNLDITTMLAYVSNLTNGSSRWTFREPILTEQAAKEIAVPLKPILDKVFKNRKLICCETAYKSFLEIVNLLGGLLEKQRAADLTARLEICEDVCEIPIELSALTFCGKIKERSLKIFAFGMGRKAVTVTSNEGFVRSAKMKGINLPVFIHQARALTEAKEETAQALPS